MSRDIMNKSALSLALITILLFSGCACNETWKEGFIKGAIIGAAVGGAGGYVSADDPNDDDEYAAIGAGIGAVAGGIIGAFTYRCEVAEVIKDTDLDGDGVLDRSDKCPDTPKGVKVDSNGCPPDADSDGDGVPDRSDKCPDTPKGVKVDSNGCPPDADGDGVYDNLDKCPGTPKGVKVDSNGCPPDADGDGVYDNLDKCPGTPKGAKVDDSGCWILKGVYFETDKWSVKPEFYPVLDEVVDLVKKNPDLRIEIQGHTDNVGTAQYNQTLSEKRAKSVMEYLVGKGINKAQLSTKGYGLQNPVAANETPEGRSRNRRVVLNPVR
jgi:OOP family OmpA-OmpF porin